ncbi:MAG TPA: hypothetical protein ACFE0H_06235 [Elainellaceae cyanobacterium]
MKWECGLPALATSPHQEKRDALAAVTLRDAAMRLPLPLQNVLSVNPQEAI